MKFNIYVLTILIFFVSEAFAGNEYNEKWQKMWEGQTKKEGNKDDFDRFAATGECIGCNLNGFDFREVIKNLNENGKKINLTASKLRGANFSGTNLEGANLATVNAKYANFNKTNLQNACLNGAVFSFAYFYKALFCNALLKKANFLNAILKKANFKEANLKRANCSDADVRKALFIEAKNFHRLEGRYSTFFQKAYCPSED